MKPVETVLRRWREDEGELEGMNLRYIVSTYVKLPVELLYLYTDKKTCSWAGAQLAEGLTAMASKKNSACSTLPLFLLRYPFPLSTRSFLLAYNTL
jgi:hypothetical protein